jgi:tRNA G18 (ribose-2'-O)-methylase SpoU
MRMEGQLEQRGYFGVGVEGISKPMNLGAILRTAHAFGASFAFTISAHHRIRKVELADTSHAGDHIPRYDWDDIDAMRLPEGCALVGVELTDDAVELPSFRHPPRAAYVLGRERGDLSEDMIARCQHVVKIPTRFCLNVGLAAALVLYDRLLAMGRFAPRPVRVGGPDAKALAEFAKEQTAAKR